MDQAFKRSNIRYLIDLEVKVAPEGHPPLLCKVRDYCLSGMFLIAPGGGAPALKKNLPITIEFDGLKNKRQRINARIVHAEAAGYGVKFEAISDESLNSLLAIATQQQAEADQGPSLAGEWQSEGNSGLLLLLKDTLQRHIISLFSNFHESAVDDIFERSSRPRDGKEQNEMFEALDTLNKRRQTSFQQINSVIIEGYDAFTENRAQPSQAAQTAAQGSVNELSLVDDREFEDWLWASSTVARLESQLDDELFALHQRLSKVFGRNIDHKSNPLGAFAICQAFQNLINSFELSSNAHELVINAFNGLIEPHFAALVHDLNYHMVNRGVLPEVKRDMRVIRLGNNTGPTSLKHPAPPEATPEQPVKAAATHPDAPDNRSDSTSAYRQRDAKNTFGDSSEIGHGPASGLAQVRSLLRSSRGATSEAGGGGGGAGGGGAGGGGAGGGGGAASAIAAGSAPGATQDNWYSDGELTNALSHIADNVASIRANRNKGESILSQLKASLAKLGGDPNRAIPAAQEESIEVIDNLMDSVHSDPVVSNDARPWFEKLEVPLLKTAIKDDSLIENRDHPATHFLNRLDAIGQNLTQKGSERSDAVRAEISTLIDQVNETSDTDDAAFDHALSRLEDLHDSMRRQYESSISELTTRFDNESALETKRDELLALLDDHFGGRMLPVVIFEIMDAGWKNLLLRSYVREGADGKIFNRFLEVIDQTIAHLTGEPQLVNGKLWPQESLLQLIPRGLSQVPVSDELIERLMSKLAPQLTMAEVDSSAIALKKMPRITELNAEKRKKAKAALIDKIKVPQERWNKAEDSIKSMHTGDMITLIDDKGEKQSHKLVWAAANQSRYAFVDGEGRLSQDLSQEELTTMMLGGKVKILEGWDVPLMDRATYSMLLSIHNKLLQQTNYDTLTGLHNRRSFETELEKMLERTRIDKTKNILCYLDLDHFSLVNSLCGHDEGDRLLKETAELLRQQAPEDALIGRLGGDEFALILPEFSRTEGLMLIRKVQQAMHAHKFQCKSQSYRLAASFGMTELTEMSESGTRLMSTVDSACRIAKENGRDRVEIHHEQNGTLAKREGLIKLVGQINEAMEHNHLQLVCQRILPISEKNVQQAPYYEILLRVQDENGHPISHAEFIQAAEMYNRSIDVDLWVATTAIDWLEQRYKSGKALPVLSINLSGRSVNSKEFMDAITERIIKTMIPRNHICFEITETAAIGDMGQATHFINRVKRTGCSFSLDDFGTGLSSYSYLKALPVDYIKIDGSFVRNCHNEPHDLAVIKSINEISHAMGKKTVAEFVENEEILKHLHEIGVDYAQGYGIEKPIPLSQLN